MKQIKLKTISEYQLKQCDLFAKYSVNTSLDQYEKRMQFNKEKIINDIYNGKIAEFMVYNYLIEAGKTPTSPDLNIYLKDKKSYDADIHIGDVKLHVKSHQVNNIFPISWLFQKNDPLILNKDNNDFLVLVVLDTQNNYMYIVNINDAVFSEPMKESLRQTKTCLYESNL